MTDRPILFSSRMVRALRAGRKTQTRRIVKPQPPADFVSAWWDTADQLVLCPASLAFSPFHKALRRLPRPGDRLWVRESFCDLTDYMDAPAFRERASPIAYMADGDFIGCHRYRPSTHMPRKASRQTLEVDGVWLERLQDISEEDARAEGCYVGKATGRVFEDIAGCRLGGPAWKSACDWYADLWEEINGPSAWSENPWVTAISFIPHACNIDKMGALA